jgi:hypothetical protein
MAGESGSRWSSNRHHLLSWVLSLETAKRHFKTTALVTDAAGAELLVEGLGLQFDEVSTELDDLGQAAADWWGLGKLVAYGSQREPFIHVDSDVYLWSPLPSRLLTAPVLGQNSEILVPGSSYYEPEVLERALADGGWLPEEWLEIRKLPAPHLGAVCCGIVGGTAIEFLAHYAAQAIKLVSYAENESRLKQLSGCGEHMILVEQFLLWACLQYYNTRPSSKFRDVRIEYLFGSEELAYRGTAVSAYTHLIGPAKRNQLIVNRLENRVRRKFPHFAARVDQLTATDGC